MLLQYLARAMASAHFEQMPGGRFWGEVPSMPGAWAEAPTLGECHRGLAEVVEGWVLLAVRDRDLLPVIGGLDITSG